MGVLDLFKKKANNPELAAALLSMMKLGGDVPKEYKREVDKLCKQFPSNNDRALKVIELVGQPDTPEKKSIVFDAYRFTKTEHRKEALDFLEKNITDITNHREKNSGIVSWVGSVKQSNHARRKSFIYAELAKLYEEEYKFKEAEKTYKKAIKYGNYSPHYVGLARVYSKMNELDKAIAVFDDYISSTPPITEEEKRIALIQQKKFEDKKTKGYVYRPRK